MADFVETGIQGLDAILGGGIPRGHIVMISGSSGTGKTILGTEFLFRGAKKNENGLYISLSESKEKFLKNISGFRFYEPKFVDTNKIRVLDINEDSRLKGLELQNVNGIITMICSMVEETSSKRVVLDSITSIAQALKDDKKIRDFVFELGIRLSLLDCTIFIISEIPPQKFMYSVFGVEEFIADGLFFLSEFERKGDLIRSFQVIKMRGLNHSRNKHIIKITSDGINLIPFFKAGVE